MYGSARKSYLQMLNRIHSQGLRRCLGAHRTSMRARTLMHMNLVWVLDVQSFLSRILKTFSLYQNISQMFDNKYMKLFDVKPNDIRTFGFRIKQFLTAFNIDVSDILETPSYFLLSPWCVKLDLMHLNKGCTYASVYKQIFLELRERYRDYISIYTDGSRDGSSEACVTVFPPDTVISTRLPDSGYIFTAEIWAIIKALEQIKD